ncbi:Ataxin-10, partial [Rhizophlyctis rosea]
FWGRVTQDLGPDAKVKLMEEGLGVALVQLLSLAQKHIPRSKLSTPKPDTPSPASPAIPTLKNLDQFFMLKSDIVKVIGNLSYETREVQDAFRELGAIPLVLAQCNIDDFNPFLKEHAIFAIRNLCDGNPENQKIIEGLEARGVADNPVLEEAGVEAVIDETGKLRLKARGGSPVIVPPTSGSTNMGRGNAGSRIREIRDEMEEAELEELKKTKGVNISVVEM